MNSFDVFVIKGFTLFKMLFDIFNIIYDYKNKDSDPLFCKIFLWQNNDVKGCEFEQNILSKLNSKSYFPSTKLFMEL